MKFKKKDNKTPSRLLNLWAGISFFIPVFIIYAYSYSDHTFFIKGYEVKKLITKKNNLFLKSDGLKSNKNKSDSAKITRTSTDNNSLIKNVDTLLPKKQWAISDYKRLNNSIEFSDTIKHRILLIGDSECGGLCFPLNNYCEQNGHKLLLTLAWNSATVFNFAFSDTINKIILKYKPSYLFIVFGLNELPARDLEQRKKAADQFAKKIEGIPYLWIGPANYMNDYGINKVFESAAETDCFFLTNNMELPRGDDGRHPNIKGYRLWMDSIAKWIKISAKYKIAMEKPTKSRYHFKSRIINLNAVNFRGY
jgi:lysophospholipase L1-like esterase